MKKKKKKERKKTRKVPFVRHVLKKIYDERRTILTLPPKKPKRKREKSRRRRRKKPERERAAPERERETSDAAERRERREREKRERERERERSAMVGSSAEDATRLDFSHGHLAGQTGLAFALEEHKKERNIKKEGESERERKGGGGGGGTKTKTTLITGGADCLTCLRTEESGFKNTDTEINDHEEVITCLAANAIASSSSSSSSSSANGRKGLQRRTDLFATGSEDRFVKLYSFPDAVFETNATRFELPVRALDFAPEGRTLACGGDDEGIRIVEIDYEDDKSCKVLRTLRTAGRSIKSIRWDPEGAFVAAVSADGTLQIWKAESGEVALTKRGVAHRFDKSSPNCAHISWQHEGIFLAVPGTSGDVLFLERLSWEEEFSLPSAADGEKLGHTGAVTCVELSPNGLYAATSGLDRRIVVWNVKDQKPIATRASDAVVCNMRWHPNQNALSLMDEEGNVGHWESPVDTSLPDPAFVEDEEEDTVPVREASEAFPADKGEKKKKMTIVESDSEESEDILGAAAAEVAVTGREQHTLRIAPPKLQKAFQPGATPLAPNSQRRFLAYNMDGYISTMRGSDFSSIEVVFHDVSSRSSRIPTLTDYYGFEMGALGPRGTILASPERGPESPSVLMYRPFESWAVGSEWTCTFPSGEEVKAVTVGTSFAAAATMNFLRVYSLAGSPRMILSIPGPVVALAANESWLALIYHEAGPVLDGNGSCSQKLAFHLYDVSSENQIASGPLCLSPGSELEWVGFSEEGIFTTCDNQGCIRGYFESYGGSWVPLFSSKDSRKAETEHHYIVGLSQKEVFCVITKSANHFPQVRGRKKRREKHHEHNATYCSHRSCLHISVCN